MFDPILKTRSGVLGYNNVEYKYRGIVFSFYMSQFARITRNMKLILLAFCCTLALSAAKPQFYQQQYQRPFVPILSQYNEHNPDGSYRFGFTTGDGKQAEESGYLKNRGTQLEAQTVQGSYSYTAPDGTPISVTYTADENGFRAYGAHLPTPPPIPAAIAKSLEYIARTQGNQPYRDQYTPQYQRY